MNLTYSPCTRLYSGGGGALGHRIKDKVTGVTTYASDLGGYYVYFVIKL